MKMDLYVLLFGLLDSFDFLSLGAHQVRALCVISDSRFLTGGYDAKFVLMSVNIVL